jgi:hypothetical protein
MLQFQECECVINLNKVIHTYKLETVKRVFIHID